MLTFHDTGDMFGVLNATAHINTVNCKGVAGAGLALLFARKHPELLPLYQSACARGEMVPGKLQILPTDHYQVINFPTKRHWQNKSILPDITAGLIALRSWIETLAAPPVITIPALGADLGGLDWVSQVKPEIERILTDAPATIHVFGPQRWVQNWFSNMKPFDQPLIYQGVSYHTVENFYQAMKLPKDNLNRRRHIAALAPHIAKKTIREEQWRSDFCDELAQQVMEYALRHKFAHGTSWAEKLITSHPMPLVEWNNRGDERWGICIKTGKGENWLGKILMDLRQNLIQRKNGE